MMYSDKGMFLIEFTVNGDRFINTYLYGSPPFDLETYKAFMKSADEAEANISWTDFIEYIKKTACRDKPFNYLFAANKSAAAVTVWTAERVAEEFTEQIKEYLYKLIPEVSDEIEYLVTAGIVAVICRWFGFGRNRIGYGIGFRLCNRVGFGLLSCTAIFKRTFSGLYARHESRKSPWFNGVSGIK